MNAGATFFFDFNGEGKHLWIVVSDPLASSVLVANFTTFRGSGVFHDPACVVEKNEHPALAHRSWVRYQDARLVSGLGLIKAINQRTLDCHQDLSFELLRRVRIGAGESEFLRLEYRKLLVDQGLIDDSF